ncbi:MAG: hypothetical protein JST90_03990 [Bacteroidetes bacterium]|nr:hypothetical protein [Bacteroidota bacterium]
MPQRYFTIALIWICLSRAGALPAQNNYWTQAYSAYSILTGGTCMTCASDNSVFVYNPGAIGFLDTLNVNISANLYGLDHLSLKNGAGPGYDLTSNKLNLNAQVLSGTISFKKIPKLRMIYGYVLRNFTKFDFETQADMSYDVISASPGPEHFRAKYDQSYSYVEYWGGIAAAYQVNEHLSLGLGHYGGYIGMQGELFQQATADVIDPSATPYSASMTSRYKYAVNHVYILFKPGMELKFGNYKIGLAAMLPSVKLFSAGKMYQSVDAVNLPAGDTLSVFHRYPNLTIVGDQHNIHTQYKLPASISLGLEYGNDKFRVAVTAEYFFAVKEYDLLRGSNNVYALPSAVYGTDPIPDFMRIRTGARQVINAGAGYDIRLSQKISLLGGFRTDFNNKVPLLSDHYKDYIVAADPEYWNYIHFSTGVSIARPHSKIFLGFTYKYGFSNYHTAFANFAEPSDVYYLAGPQRYDMGLSSHGISFVLGYTNFSSALFGLPLKAAKQAGTPDVLAP